VTCPRLRVSPRRSRRRLRRQTGAASVEFAIVATLVLIPLLFGVISFGIGFAQKVTLTSAVRDGARFGSVNIFAAANDAPRTCKDVVDATRANAKTVGMTGGQVKVTVRRGSVGVCSAEGASYSGSPTTPACMDAADTDNLSVTAEFTGRITIPLVLSKPVALKSTGVYRCEYN
jgi:Flp pilus assembly protein TadG